MTAQFGDKWWISDSWWFAEVGADTLGNDDHESESTPRAGSRFERVWDQIRRRPLVKAWRLLKQSGHYRVVSTTGADVSIWYGLLRLLSRRRPKAKHLVIAFFLTTPRRTLMRVLWPLLRPVIGKVLNAADLILVHATAETAIYRETLGLHKRKLLFVPCGGDDTALRTVPCDCGVVVAAGRDYRDFATFFEAMEAAGVAGMVIAPKGTVSAAALPSNVELRESVPWATFVELLSRATIVVVPLEDRARSLGQITLLQAMALSKPVVATRTVGTIDYISHGVSGVLVPPDDAEALRHWISLLWSDPALRGAIGAKARYVAECICRKRFLGAVAATVTALGENRDLRTGAASLLGDLGQRPCDLATEGPLANVDASMLGCSESGVGGAPAERGAGRARPG